MAKIIYHNNITKTNQKDPDVNGLDEKSVEIRRYENGRIEVIIDSREETKFLSKNSGRFSKN